MSNHDDERLLNRRTVLQWSAVGGLAASGLPLSAATPAAPATPPAVRRHVTLGRTGLRISDISFGSSRLRLGQEDLIAHAIDRGINYIDSAENYTRGESETTIGNALVGKRDRVYLVSKVQADAEATRAFFMESLEGSLKRLRTDYVDVYMNHAVNDVARMQSDEWREFIATAKQQGKIRFSGMSGHGGRLAECLDYALDNDLVDVMLVAHNFGQDPKFYEQFTRGLDFVAKQPELPRLMRKAKEKNVGVIAMKTLMGARLNDMRPHEHGGATFAQAAFRWVLTGGDADALIVTMNSREQIDEYLGASGAEKLADGDLTLLGRYAHMNGQSYCRFACNDCAGACPYGVPIADVMRTRMYANDYGDLRLARDEYALLRTNASACLSCSGQPCQGACSHGLPVASLCGPTHQMLS
jgi:hypothetical protein